MSNKSIHNFNTIFEEGQHIFILFNALLMGLETTINEHINASRVDYVNATILPGPTLNQIRKQTAFNRETFKMQRFDLYYNQKDIKKAGLIEAAVADGAFVSEDKVFVGFAEMKAETVESSEMSRIGAFKIASSGTVYTTEKTGISVGVVDDYSDEIILVNCQCANFKNGVNIMSHILAAEVVLKVEVAGKCRLYLQNGNGYWHDIRFNQVNKKLKVNLGRHINGFPEGAKITAYTPFQASASMQRGTALYLLKADREEIIAAEQAAEMAAKKNAESEEICRILEQGLKLSYNKAVGKATSIIDSLSGGVYSRIKNSLNDETISLEKRNKTASRMSLPITNSNRFGEVTKFAFANYENVDRDGHGFFNADFMAAAYKEKFPEADPVNFDGKWVQARLLASMKGGHTCVTPEFMEEAIKADAEIIFLEKKNLTAAFKKYIDGCGSNIMKKKYDGKILVWGTKNLKEVEFFGDLTTFKTIPNFGEPMPVALMDMNKSIEKTVNTSNQVIAKMLRVPEAKEALEAMFKEAIDKNFKMEAKDNISSFSEFGTVEYGVDALLKINPEFVLKDENLTKTVLEACVKSSINMLSHLSIPVEGFNAIMVPDYGSIFGVKLIDDKEMFVSGDEHVGRKAQLIRHPSSSSGEHVGVKIISLKKVLVRIASLKVEGKLTENQANVLTDLFENLEGNIAILPVNKVLVNKLGGADWDGDTVNVYLDKRIVNLLEKVPEEAINYGSIKPSGVTVKVDDRMIVDAYKSFVDCGNRPIGMVVDFILGMSGTLAAIKSGKLARHNLQTLLLNMKIKSNQKASINNVDGICDKNSVSPESINWAFVNNKTYIPQFVGDDLFIDAKRREEFAEYVKSVGIGTPENFELFLEDVIKAYSGIANDTIDAAKKGGKVDCWFYDLSQYIVGGLLAPVTLEYDEEKNLIVNAPQLGIAKDKETMRYVSEDIGAEIKVSAAQYLRDKIEEVLAKADACRVEEESFVEDDIYGDQDYLKADKEALRHLAVFNTALNNGAPSLYGDVKANVLAFARVLARNAVSTPQERYDLFKESSMMKDETRSGFYIKFGPEMLYAAMEDKDFNLRSRLYSMKNGIMLEDGDEIQLSDGKGINGIFTEDKLTGIFKVEVENGKAYATMSAKKYLESFMEDSNKFIVKLKTGDFLKNRVELSGKNGINSTVAAANNLLKKEIDILTEKMNSGEYIFKLERSGISGLALVAFKKGSARGGERFSLLVFTPNSGKGQYNSYVDVLAGKEVDLKNIVSFNYWKAGTTRGIDMPEFVVALTGNIIK